MLNSCIVVVINIFLNLRFLFSQSWLVYWHFYIFIVISKPFGEGSFSKALVLLLLLRDFNRFFNNVFFEVGVNKIVVLGCPRLLRMMIIITFVLLLKDITLEEFHERAKEKCGDHNKDQAS